MWQPPPHGAGGSPGLLGAATTKPLGYVMWIQADAAAKPVRRQSARLDGLVQGFRRNTHRRCQFLDGQCTLFRLNHLDNAHEGKYPNPSRPELLGGKCRPGELHEQTRWGMTTEALLSSGCHRRVFRAIPRSETSNFTSFRWAGQYEVALGIPWCSSRQLITLRSGATCGRAGLFFCDHVERTDLHPPSRSSLLWANP